MAVTDEAGRVYGVDGLRVVDASIMPVIPCANTNFPTMMVAERIAAMMVEEELSAGATRMPGLDTIARIDGFHLAIPAVYGGPQPRGSPQWPRVRMLLVRVETADGAVGWGEAFGHKACAATKAALDTLVAPACIGADAADIAGSRNARGARCTSMASTDRWASRCRASTSRCGILAASAGASAPSAAPTRIARRQRARLCQPAALRRCRSVGEAAADAVTRGHHAVKLHEATVEAVVAARAAIGADVPLALDVNCRWSVEQAIAKRVAG